MASITLTVGTIEQALELPEWHSALTKVLEVVMLFSSIKTEMARREQTMKQDQKLIEHLVARIDLCANDDCPNKPESYKNSMKKCSQCKVIAYCSKNCQIADWEIHKLVCKK